MRFQERDGDILSMIYEYDGVLARRHLKQVFWPDATLRAAQKRLARLVDNGYLTRPTSYQRRTQPIPEPIYWLDWKGILWVAGQSSAAVDPPASQSEYKMRKLAKQLRDQGIHWLREPRWIQLAHDLAVIDFRFAVEQAVEVVPGLGLETWLHESEFRSNGDKVKYWIRDRDRKARWMEKRVYPDSYFVVVSKRRMAQGLLPRVRYLVEMDNATHTNQRFGREKVAPGLAYIKSPQYKTRFGCNGGWWLVVTTGRVRMNNLKRQTQQVARTESGVFLFTTFEQIETANVLTDPMWWQAGKEDPIPLLSRDELS